MPQGDNQVTLTTTLSAKLTLWAKGGMTRYGVSFVALLVGAVFVFSSVLTAPSPDGDDGVAGCTGTIFFGASGVAAGACDPPVPKPLAPEIPSPFGSRPSG